MKQFKFKTLVFMALLILVWVVLSTLSAEKKLMNRVLDEEPTNNKTLSYALKDNKNDKEEQDIVYNLDSIVKQIITDTINKKEVEVQLSTKQEVEEEIKKVESLTNKILVGVDVFEDGENKFEESMDFSNSIEEVGKDTANKNTDIVGAIIGSKKDIPIDYNMNYRVAELVEIISGDEIIASIDDIPKVVKLIGIDSEQNDYKALAAILSGIETIYLEFDIKRYDNKDRALAYVWISEPDRENRGNMVNGMLIKGGFAKLKTSSPNVVYSAYFNRLQKEANK